MNTKDKIIEIFKNHQHSMAGHNWLIGLDESDFILIADEILALQKEELIKFMTWYNRHFDLGTVEKTSTDIVNDYLKTKRP